MVGYGIIIDFLVLCLLYYFVENVFNVYGNVVLFWFVG